MTRCAPLGYLTFIKYEWFSNEKSVYYCTLLVGAGRILEDVSQTGSCEDPVDEIEDVAEPLDDSVDEEIEDVAEPLDDSVGEEI